MLNKLSRENKFDNQI